MNPLRLIILGVGLVVLGIVLVVGGKTDSEKKHPDREFTPMREQWPISMLFGGDWNLRSVSALVAIVIGFSLQAFAVLGNS